MRLEDQLCTQKQAKKLKELGVIQDAHFTWVFDSLNCRWEIGILKAEAYEILNRSNSFDEFKQVYPAFSVAELGVMLPDMVYDRNFYMRKCWKGISFGYSQPGGKDHVMQDWYKLESHARADLLIHGLVNNLPGFEIIEINSRLKAKLSVTPKGRVDSLNKDLGKP